MKRTGLVVLSLGLLGIACGSSDDSVINTPKPIVDTDRLVVFSTLQADQIKVEANTLTLPLQGHEELLARKVGDVLVSDRGSATGTNPVGFLRKLKSVAKQGTQIVIQTEPAALTDVIKKASTTAKLSIAKGGTSQPTAQHEPIGQTSQALEVSKSIKFPMEPKEVTLSFKGKSIKIDLAAELEATGALAFDPTFDLGLTISDFKVSEFHAIANGSITASLELVGSGTATWEAELTKKEPATEFGKALKELIESNTDLKYAKPLWGTSYPLPTFFVGPVPVVTDLNLALDLDCKLTVEGSVEAKYKAIAKANFSGGIKFENEVWSPVSSMSFSQSHEGPTFTVGGGATVECGLKPTLQLRFYGFVGPYIFVKATGGITADLTTECGPNEGLPTCSAGVKANASVEAGVGAKVDISVLGLTFRQDLGELPLLKQTLLDDYPLLGPFEFGECALGYCFASTPTCGDGSCNGSETCTSCQQDCGACVQPKCGDSTCNGTENCTTCPGDCGACPAGCPDGSCNNGETCKTCPQDCGACPASCGDTTCNGTESCSTCPQDCGACPAQCPDGSCNGGETCSTCPQDCGECPTQCPSPTCSSSSVGQTRCDPDNDNMIQKCNQVGNCYQWQTLLTCPSGYDCKSGGGTPTCAACWPEAYTCNGSDTSHLYFCTDNTGDGYPDFWTDSSHKCPAGLTCSAGYCPAGAALRECDSNGACHCCL